MKNKAVISLLSILAIVLAVFAYLLSTNKLTSNNNFRNELKDVQTVSESDEIADIEKDIIDTDLSEIDSEIGEIEKELDSAVNEL